MVFDPYSDLGTYAKNKSVNFSNFDDTEVVSQNFLDMGCLEIGSRCVIRLTIVNDTPYEITVSAAVDGRLSNEPLKITAMPNGFCPGLSHSIFISFTVCETVRNMSCTAANIVTQCTSPTQPGFHMSNCCPVFFRALRPDPPTTTTGASRNGYSASSCRAALYPLCNESLLADLLDKFDLKGTLLNENNMMRYNPSSNSFTYPQQQDFTHSHHFDPRKTSAAASAPASVSTAAASSSVFAINPGAVPALVRGESTAPLGSPVIITRTPSATNMKLQFNK